MEIVYYIAPNGVEIVTDWLDRLRDKQAKARFAARITRLAAGNFGDCKPLREGVWELRIDWGPRYRLY